MKFTKNTLMALGLLLQVGVSFTAFSDEGQTIEGQLILNNQEQQEKSENIDRVVVGEIVRIDTPSDSEQPKAIWSSIHTQAFNNDGYEIEVAPSEIMVSLEVKYNYADLSEEDREMIPDDWDAYTHPRLGKGRLFSLPLHLFLNEKGELKDEAEEVIFYVQTDERIKVVLTIRTDECVVYSTGVPFVVKTEGYRSKMQSYLDENPNLINASLR